MSLGNTRYVWFTSTSKWNEEKEKKFTAWLSSCNVDGLAGVPHGVQARYLITYKNNLVGKHFRWISQLTVFSLHWGGCDPILFDLWKATGELSALVWCTKILDMDQYVVRSIVSWQGCQPDHQNPAPGWYWHCSCKCPWYMDKNWSQPHHCQAKTPCSHSPARRCAAVWSPNPIWGWGIRSIKPGVPSVQRPLQPSCTESRYCNDDGPHGEVQAHH